MINFGCSHQWHHVIIDQEQCRSKPKPLHSNMFIYLGHALPIWEQQRNLWHCPHHPHALHHPASVVCHSLIPFSQRYHPDMHTEHGGLIIFLKLTKNYFLLYGRMVWLDKLIRKKQIANVGDQRWPYRILAGYRVNHCYIRFVWPTVSTAAAAVV